MVALYARVVVVMVDIVLSCDAFEYCALAAPNRALKTDGRFAPAAQLCVRSTC